MLLVLVSRGVRKFLEMKQPGSDKADGGWKFGFIMQQPTQ